MDGSTASFIAIPIVTTLALAAWLLLVAAREDDATGELLLEGRTGQTAAADGVRTWADRIADSFYIDLSTGPGTP